MTGRTHDAAAFAALVAVVIYTPHLPTMSLTTATLAFGANFIGGLFPDIDQPTSHFWDNFRLGPIFAKFVTPMLGGHRSLSHSILGVVLLGLLADRLFAYLSSILLLKIDYSIVWTSFMIGVLSHIVMDLITKEGVPLLWPFGWKFGIPPIKALRITTGKLMEKLIIFPGLVSISIYLIYTHQDKVLHFLRNNIK